MKTIIRVFFGLALSLQTAIAANPTPFTFDVQGLILGGKYTDTQTRSKLGNNPIKMYTWDDGEVIGREYLYANSNKFRFGGDQDVLTYFFLDDSRYSVFEGHLKVGDYLYQKIGLLCGGLLVYEKSIGNKNLYHFYPSGKYRDEVYLSIITYTSYPNMIKSMSAQLPN